MNFFARLLFSPLCRGLKEGNSDKKKVRDKLQLLKDVDDDDDICKVEISVLNPPVVVFMHLEIMRS